MIYISYNQVPLQLLKEESQVTQKIIFFQKELQFLVSLYYPKNRDSNSIVIQIHSMYTTTTFFKSIIFIAIPLQIFAQSRGNLFYNEANHYSAPIRFKSYCWVLFQCLFNITLHITLVTDREPETWVSDFRNSK